MAESELTAADTATGSTQLIPSPTNTIMKPSTNFEDNLASSSLFDLTSNVTNTAENAKKYNQ